MTSRKTGVIPTITSSDPTVAIVTNRNNADSRGFYFEIIGKKAGKTTITVEYYGVKQAFVVTIVPPSITLNVGDMQKNIGERAGCLVMTTNKGAAPPTFSSDNPAVATVENINNNDSRGYYFEVVGHQGGEANITVTREGTVKTFKVQVVGDFNFNQYDSLIGIGREVRFYVPIAFVVGSDPVVTSSDASVASVVKKSYSQTEGYQYSVVGHRAGTAHITVSYQGITKTFDVTVRASGIQRGIDVSEWNGSINWTAVKNSGIRFAFVRVGGRYGKSGAIYADDCFDANMRGATANGLNVGVYFFTQAITEAEAREEARYACAQAAKYSVALPIVIDTESLDGCRHNAISVQQRTNVVRAFCEEVERQGYTPMIYANVLWFNNNLYMNQLSSYQVWVAQYYSYCEYTGPYSVWQYSSTGRVNGISENVDVNYYYY